MVIGAYRSETLYQEIATALKGLAMTDFICGAYLLTNPASAGEWRVKDAAPYNISYLVTHNS